MRYALLLFLLVLTGSVIAQNTPSLGESIPMGTRYTKRDFVAAALPTTITPQGRTQIMSNRPENVSGEGVLYRGTLSGLGSVYFYHVNADLTPRRFAAALRNPGSAAVTVTLTALGTSVKEGGYGYRYGGQEVALQVLSARPPEVLTVPANGWLWLEPTLPQTAVGYRGGVTLQAELEASAPVEVLIVSLDESTTGIDTLADSPADLTGAGRGTFAGAERAVAVTIPVTPAMLAGSEQGFTLSPDEDWVFGVDEMTGEEAQNRGNYGMRYRTTATLGNSTDEALTVRLYVVNIGCVISGAIRHEDGTVFKLPSDMLGVLDVNNYGTLIAEVTLGAGEQTAHRFDFTPPGFSCLPIGVVARAYPTDE